MKNEAKVFLAVVFFSVLIIVPASGKLHAGDDLPVVRVGVLAKRGPELCLTQWTPTADYLTERIPGKTFRIIPVDFDDIYSLVENGEVEFILTNSSFYVELEVWYRVNRIATLKNLHAGTSYTHFAGVIFSRADRTDLATLNDLRNKRFMAVEETSFGGWRMAWRELLERGIDPHRDFASLSFGGTHDAVVYAILEGSADAGTVRSDTLERMANEGRIRLDQFHVFPYSSAGENEIPFLHSTRTYPEWPFAKVRHTSDDLAQQVAVALLQMPADEPAAQAAECAGWGIPFNYQSVHDCLRELKVGPYKDLGRITLAQATLALWRWILAGVLSFGVLGGATFIIFKLNRHLTLSNHRLRQEAEWREQATLALEESEQFNRTIISSVGEGLVVYDRDMRYRIWNRHMEHLTGLSETEVVGRSALDLFPHLSEEGVDRLFERALAGETVHSPDTRFYVPQTGRSGWVVGSYTPHVSVGGQTIGVVGTVSDMTHRKAVEQELLASNERFRAVMEGLDALVYVADMETYEVFYINRHGRQTWGDAVGKTCWKVLQSGQSGPCAFCSNNLLIDEEGNPTGIHVWEFRNTVDNRWYECRDQAIRWTDGRLVRMEIATDITERKQVQDELMFQNRFLNHIIQSLTHPFMVINAEDYSVQIANDAAGDNYPGCKCHHLTHRSEHPCGDSDHPCPVAIIRSTGRPVVVEHLHFNRDGDLRNVEVYGYPIFDGEGRVSKIIEYSLDITDRKRTEKELQEKEEYLRTILGTIQTGVMISEQGSGRIVDVNPFAAWLIGEDADTIVNRPLGLYLEEGLEINGCDQRAGEREDALLSTVQHKKLSVRLSKADVCIRDQSYTIHGFLDISDIKELIEQQAVNIELAKRLLTLVNPGFPRLTHVNEQVSLHTEAISLPCQAVGGDHFFVRRLPGGGNGVGPATYLSVKDQSGHEVNCILRSIFTDLIHNTILQNDSSTSFEHAIQQLNGRLIRGNMFAGDDFLTAMLACIDHRTLYMQYASCGHPPFLLIRDGRVVSLPQAGGFGQNLPLGTIEDINLSAGRIRLRIGDKLLFYTDGLTEMPLKRNGWKISRLQLEELVTGLLNEKDIKGIGDLMRSLMAAVAHMSGQRLTYPDINTSDDDVTLIGLELEDRTVGQAMTLVPKDRDELYNHIRDLSELIAGQWEPAGLANAAQRVRMVLEEAVLNAWKNGHRAELGRPITVRWREGNDFFLEVIDTGDGFDPDMVADPTLPKNVIKSSGRGIYMIRIFADEVQWADSGRHLTACFFRHAQMLDPMQCKPH